VVYDLSMSEHAEDREDDDLPEVEHKLDRYEDVPDDEGDSGTVEDAKKEAR